ncbi:MAG: Asp23/Gls24 family envelope stress response protein [Lachnospiraceae bacterium]|nr:Asp23/Gls24 family envelope stress response protein [Lachnospiraceae bacterium]
MKSIMNTHMGNIIIDSDVIANYAGSVAIECFGVVGMASVNVKDGIVKLLKMENLSTGVTVRVENSKLIIDFHLIVAYGVNILTVSDNLISNVKYKVEEFTGLSVEKVNVFVEGVRCID